MHLQNRFGCLHVVLALHQLGCDACSVNCMHTLPPGVGVHSCQLIIQSASTPIMGMHRVIVAFEGIEAQCYHLKYFFLSDLGSKHYHMSTTHQ